MPTKPNSVILYKLSLQPIALFSNILITKPGCACYFYDLIGSTNWEFFIQVSFGKVALVIFGTVPQDTKQREVSRHKADRAEIVRPIA